MKLAYKISLVFLLAGLLVTGLQAKNHYQEFTKTIKKEFDITRDGTTNIKNKYGKVDIKTWDKNRVKIDVRIVVNARSEKSAQEVFDRIDIGFSNGYPFRQTLFGFFLSQIFAIIHFPSHLVIIFEGMISFLFFQLTTRIQLFRCIKSIISMTTLHQL